MGSITPFTVAVPDEDIDDLSAFYAAQEGDLQDLSDVDQR